MIQSYLRTSADRPRRHPRRGRIYLSAALMLALLFVSCTPGRPRRIPTTSEEPAIAVEAPRITPAPVRHSISVNGEVEPLSSVDVFPASAGELVEIPVAVGDRVVRDQVIARIDPSRPGQVFTTSPVRAPISGTVVRLPARIGAQVSPQSPIARIATTDQLQIVTAVPERFIRATVVGQRAVVRFDAYPDRVYEARVNRIAPAVDPQARTLETILSLAEADARIKPGMFARVELVLAEQPAALTVPLPAVVRRDGRPYVYVLDAAEERAHLRPVTTGIESDGRVELTSGVDEGQRVVIRGQNLLDDGARVRVIDSGNGD